MYTGKMQMNEQYTRSRTTSLQDCSTGDNFPLHLWEKFLPQALISLNLLQGSLMNPQLSAHAHLYGAFDYNCTLMDPHGIRVLVNKKSDPTALGLHIPSTAASKHCRCYRVWVRETHAERIADTLDWFLS
jgi:hypothetical protein